MYEFFYSFHNNKLANGLFNRASANGQPPVPPPPKERITEDGQTRITEDGQIRETEN